MKLALSDQSMGMLIMFVAFGVSGVTGYLYPNPDQLIFRTMLNTVALVLILFGFWMMGVITSKEGNEWTHLKMRVRIWPSAKPFDIDFYISEPKAAYETDVRPLEVGDLMFYPYTISCKEMELKLQDLESDPKNPITYDFGRIREFMAFLPEPYTRFFRFFRREDGAEMGGQDFTHSHSEAPTAYLAPYEHLTPGETKPMLFFVEAAGSALKAMRKWGPQMKVIAETDMDAYIAEHRDELYPKSPPAEVEKEEVAA